MGSDTRLDKMMTWALMFFCGLALSIGAWFFSGLDNSVKALTHAVGDLKTEVAVMRRDAEELSTLRKELKDHIAAKGHPAILATISGLEARITSIESQIRNR